MTRFTKSQYIELTVVGGTGTSQFTFQPQTYLQGRRTTCLEAFTSNDITTSKFNNAVVTVAQLKTCFLTLECNDTNYQIDVKADGTATGQAFGQWFKDIPLWDLHRVSNGTDPYVRDLFETNSNLLITWEKSFIYTTNPALFVAGTTYAFVLNVGYL